MTTAKKKKPGNGKHYIYKSAITGKTVTKKFAEENPDTTIRQQVKKKQ